MKIINLQAENIKKITAIEIAPDGNMVQITGKNGQGKTAVLDSIWWALGGTKPHQPRPIRDGETKATIRLDLGTLIVTREFKKVKDGRITTKIMVQNVDGSSFSSPQTMLDNLIDSLSFDPLSFARMDSVAQYHSIKMLVPDYDFNANERLNKDDYDERASQNRIANMRKSQADGIEVDENAPTEPIDVTSLMKDLTSTRDKNETIRQQSADKDAIGIRYTDSNADISRLTRQLEIQKELHESIEKELKEFPEIPDQADTSEIEEKISNAGTVNETVANLKRRNELLAEHEEARKKSEELTANIKKRTTEMKKAIEDAKMPVSGLSIDDGKVMLDGFPFEQASDAQQLRVSAAIAMRGGHDLRVIRIRDGSLLDEDSLAILQEMADKEDYQVWIERVDSSGKIGFVIEDGTLANNARDEQGELV